MIGKFDPDIDLSTSSDTGESLDEVIAHWEDIFISAQGSPQLE